MHISRSHAFVNALIARAIDPDDSVGYARAHWGAQSDAVLLLQKTAIGGITSASPLSQIGSADDHFFGTVLEGSVLGKIKYRRTPFNVRLLRASTATRGYWIGESKPIPLSLPTLTGSSLPSRKIAAILVSTLEGLKSASPLAVQRLEDDLRNALTGLLDETFLDAANAGTPGQMPASVTYGASSTASSGNVGNDLATLIEHFAGDLAQAVFISDARTASRIALARDTHGGFSFPDAGPRGGSILGIPLLVSAGSPRTTSGGQIVLLDPTAVAGNVERIEVSRSTQATLEMGDDPTGATDTPVAASKTLVSMFQSDSVAFKAVLTANWEVQRAAAAVITGAHYSTGAA